MYLVGYGIVRFFVEGLRTDSLMFGPIRMAQLTSVVFIVIGIFGLVGGFRKIFKAKKPIIVWDLDGTILDTEPAIIETYRRLFMKYGKESDFDQTKQLEVLGPPLRKMFPIYFKDQDVEKLIEEYREINYELHKDYVKPMKNAKEVLEALYKDGYRMAIVSTKMKSGVEFGLGLFDMNKYFEVIVGEGDVSKGKPDPEGIIQACKMMNVSHDDLIYIGDSNTDIQAATSAGAYSIGYLFNNRREDAIIKANPNKIIRDLDEVLEIVKEKHAWTYNMM